MKQERKKGVTLSYPIILGSVAFYMGKKSPGEHSHSWNIYLRSADGKDLSYLLEKVVFTLHPSCSQPVVIIEEPPFQVTQTGWGEFDAAITFHFKNGIENPVTNHHFLKLFPEGVTVAGPNTSTTIPVVSEVFDEFLFVNPTVSLFNHLSNEKLLTRVPEIGFIDLKKWFKDFKKESETCLQSIEEANSFLTKQIDRKLNELSKLK